MQQVKVLSKVTFPKDELIFSLGDPSEEIFLIQEGTVELFEIDETGQEKRIKLISCGYAFGEQALISSEKRKHSARATSDVLCVAVNRRNLLKQLDNEDPFIAALFRILQTNMRSVTKMGKRPNQDELANITEALTMSDNDCDISKSEDHFK